MAFLKIVVERRSKKTIFENAIRSKRHVWILTFLKYFPYYLSDSYTLRVSPRALHTSKLAILSKRYCTNHDSAVSSSRRLPTSFGGLLGFLRAASWLPRLLLGRPQKAPRAPYGPRASLPRPQPRLPPARVWSSLASTSSMLSVFWSSR